MKLVLILMMGLQRAVLRKTDVGDADSGSGLGIPGDCVSGE